MPAESTSEPTRWRTDVLLWTAATLVFAASVAADRPEWLRGPAPYPPEWQWLLREEGTSGRFLPVAVSAGALVLLIAATGRAWGRPVRAAALLLAAGTASGVGFSLALLGLEPAGALDTVFGRVVYRTATSYYTVAVGPEGKDPLDFVRRHDELLPTFRKAAKHAATHPPGPVLYYRAILALCEASPWLTRAVLDEGAIPDVSPRHPQPHHEPAARAAALLGGLGMIVLCALTAWPVAALARALGTGPLAATRLGLLWLLLPGPVLMAPQIDQSIALPVAAAAAALATALGAEDTARARRAAVLAGLGGAIATFLTYGAPAFLVIAGLAAAGASWARGLPIVVILARLVLAGGVTAALFALPTVVGHRPLASAAEALRIHREFYTAPRDYGVWLVFDPLDLAVFLGVPLAAALVAAVARSWRRRVRSPIHGFRNGALLGLALLIVSGQTRAEVGRLWIPIMPIFLVAALAEDDGPPARVALWLALLLAVCCVFLRVYWRLA